MSKSLFQSVVLIILERLKRFKLNILYIFGACWFCSFFVSIALAIFWLFLSLSPIILNIFHKIVIYKSMYDIAMRDNLARSKFLDYYPCNQLTNYMHYSSFEAYRLYLEKHRDEVSLQDEVTLRMTNAASLSILTLAIIYGIEYLYY